MNVENVVKPPHIPTDININASFLGRLFLSRKAINNPMTKHPIKLEMEVPKGKEIIILLEYFVIKYLTVLPTPPPKKTKIKDLISKAQIID